MGHRFSEVTNEAGMASYEVVRGDNDTARVKIGDRPLHPQEISAMVLQKMKRPPKITSAPK